MAQGKTVDGYVDQLPDWQVLIANELRSLVMEAAPMASETVKWSHPVYEVNGPMCYFRAFKQHVNFGFWRGAQIDDPERILQGDGDKMKHVRLTSSDQIRHREFQDLVRKAVVLNQTLGDPTKG